MGRHAKQSFDRWGYAVGDHPHLKVSTCGTRMQCHSCDTFRSRSDLYETAYDTECLLCRRKRDRLKGIDMDPATGDPDVREQRRHVAIKVGFRRNKAETGAAELVFEAWKRSRGKELQAQGLKFGADYRQVLLEVPAKRIEMRLPPL